jgi:hypothetical protein
MKSNSNECRGCVRRGRGRSHLGQRDDALAVDFNVGVVQHVEEGVREVLGDHCQVWWFGTDAHQLHNVGV